MKEIQVKKFIMAHNVSPNKNSRKTTTITT